MLKRSTRYRQTTSRLAFDAYEEKWKPKEYSSGQSLTKIVKKENWKPTSLVAMKFSGEAPTNTVTKKSGH